MPAPNGQRTRSCVLAKLPEDVDTRYEMRFWDAGTVAKKDGTPTDSNVNAIENTKNHCSRYNRTMRFGTCAVVCCTDYDANNLSPGNDAAVNRFGYGLGRIWTANESAAVNYRTDFGCTSWRICCEFRVPRKNCDCAAFGTDDGTGLCPHRHRVDCCALLIHSCFAKWSAASFSPATVF